MFGLPTSWLLLGGFAVGLTLAGAGYIKGRSDANANCRAAAIQAELDTVRADLRNSEAAARVAEAAARTLTAEAVDRDARIREYETTLAGRDACALSPDDVERLRQLGGPR